MTQGDLEKKLSDIGFDYFQYEEDNYGQIIIYTGLMKNERGELVDFVDEDEEDENAIEPTVLDCEDDSG